MFTAATPAAKKKRKSRLQVASSPARASPLAASASAGASAALPTSAGALALRSVASGAPALGNGQALARVADGCVASATRVWRIADGSAPLALDSAGVPEHGTSLLSLVWC